MTYQIANLAVSLGIPVYYAHKLDDRARLHLMDGSEAGSVVSATADASKLMVSGLRVC